MECDELWPCNDELEAQAMAKIYNLGCVDCGRASCPWSYKSNDPVDAVKAYSKHIREDHFGHQETAPEEVCAQQGAGEEEQATDAGQPERDQA